MPQFRIVVILSGIFAVQNFIPILLLTNGGPGTATLVPGLDMYQSAFQNDQYGYGMAIGTLLFVVMLVFTLAAMRAAALPDHLARRRPSPRMLRFTAHRGVDSHAHQTLHADAAGRGCRLAAGCWPAACAAGCSSGGSRQRRLRSSIKAVLPPNTGPITAADNAGPEEADQPVRSRAQERHRAVAAEQHRQHHRGQRHRWRARPPAAARRTWSGSSTARSPPARCRRACCRTSSPTWTSPTRTCRATPAGCRCSPRPRSRT